MEVQTVSFKLFLGQASNYKARDVLRHTFSFATKQSATRLEEFLAKKYNTTSDRVILMNNGRSAIAAGLKLCVPKGSEVIINGFTCYAVLQAVEKAHCKPIYADINEKTLNFDKKTLEKVLEKHPKVKAIIIQNTLGISVNISEIELFAKKHNLVIIEDLAHCAGMKYLDDGREIGSVGAVSALSFGKGKSLDAITGGALIVNDRNLPLPKKATKHPKLSDSLRARWYPLLAAIGRGMSRIRLQKYWYGPLIKMHFIERAVDAKLSFEQRPTYWQDKLILKQLEKIGNNPIPIRTHLYVNNRNELLDKLEKNGYNFREIWYDVPVSPIRYYKKLNFPENECPVATKVSAEIINIPTYYEKNKLSGALQIIKEYEK